MNNDKPISVFGLLNALHAHDNLPYREVYGQLKTAATAEAVASALKIRKHFVSSAISTMHHAGLVKPLDHHTFVTVPQQSLNQEHIRSFTQLYRNMKR